MKSVCVGKQTGLLIKRQSGGGNITLICEYNEHANLVPQFLTVLLRSKNRLNTPESACFSTTENLGLPCT